MSGSRRALERSCETVIVAATKCRHAPARRLYLEKLRENPKVDLPQGRSLKGAEEKNDSGENDTVSQRQTAEEAVPANRHIEQQRIRETHNSEHRHKPTTLKSMLQWQSEDCDERGAEFGKYEHANVRLTFTYPSSNCLS